jgi:phage terminase large subunit
MTDRPTVKIQFLSEFRELFNEAWRNIVFYGGRGCFSPDTLVATPDGHRKLGTINSGDLVYSVSTAGAVVPKQVIAVHHYDIDFDPKPILKLRIGNEEITTTYDHRFFYRGYYVPIYKLAWGAMAPSQRIQLELLCEQYGTTLDHELQGRPQNSGAEASEGRQRLSSHRPERSHDQSSSRYRSDLAQEPISQSDREPHQRGENGQLDREPGVGHEGRADIPRHKIWADEDQARRAGELGEADGAERPVHTGRVQKTEISPSGSSRLSADVRGLGGNDQGCGPSTQLEAREVDQIRVLDVCESVATVDLTVADHHNYLVTKSNFHVHNSGKSQHVALALILRGRQKRLRILCTRELQNTIADSVHKELSDIISRYGFTDYEITEKTIRNTITGSEFIFKGLRHNSTEIKSMSGIDIAWVEEAQSISEASLKLLIPTIRKAGSQLIYTFNRMNELDPVYVRYVRQKRARTFVRKVNYDVLDRAGLLPAELREEMEADRAASLDLYTHVWLGEPMAQADGAILARSKVLQAMERDNIAAEGAIEIGVDVARMGDDRSVLSKRHGMVLVEMKSFTKLRTTELCDRVEAFADYDKEVLLKIDDTGVGGGVTDEMMKRGYHVMAVNFGAKPHDVDKYPNLISEAWFHLANIIDTIQLDLDDDLLMELTSRQWKMDNAGRRRVESKDDYKKRGFRSPDLADSLIMCFYNPEPDPLDNYEEEFDDDDSFTSGLLDEDF